MLTIYEVPFLDYLTNTLDPAPSVRTPCVYSTSSHHLLGIRAPEALSLIWSLPDTPFWASLCRARVSLMGMVWVKGVHINRSTAQEKRPRGNEDYCRVPGCRPVSGPRPFAISPALCSAPPSLGFLSYLTALLGSCRKAGSAGPENDFMGQALS